MSLITNTNPNWGTKGNFFSIFALQVMMLELINLITTFDQI